MSISYFVADLPPKVAKNVCVIREEITQAFSHGFCGLSGSMPVPEKKHMRHLIRVSDVASIFNLPQVDEVLAVLYDEQKHVRAVNVTSADGSSSDQNPANVRHEVFIDDRGFLRVLARLVRQKWLQDGDKTKGDDTVCPGGTRRGEKQEEEYNGDDGDDGVDGTRDNGGAVSPKRGEKGNHSGYHRKPFVRLSKDGRSIVQVFLTKQDLVKQGGLKTAASAVSILNDPQSEFCCWKSCPLEAKEDFFRRGGQLPTSLKKKSNMKAVDQLEDMPGGKLLFTYASMTDAIIGVGARSSSMNKLKQAIHSGKPWRGFRWRLSMDGPNAEASSSRASVLYPP